MMKHKALLSLMFLLTSLPSLAQSYEYDTNNRLTKVTYSDGSTVTYTYDELGNRLSMKKTAGIENEVISFADPIVRFVCVNNWDEDGDGELSYDEAAAVTYLGEVFQSKDITSFDELQYFTGLEEIGPMAFYDCGELSSICFPESLNSIGSAAFNYCNSLHSIVIPSSVTYVGSSVFGGCTELVSIVVNEGNSKYDSRDNCNAIIQKSNNSLIAGCINTVIPNTVKSIYYGAFMGLSTLSSILIPNSVTSIGSNAFYKCNGLTSITIPNSVTNIGTYAFNGCTNLESVYSEILNPFTFNENVFQVWDTNTSSMVFSNATLYVPAGTKEAYLATPAWNQFLNIVETDPNPIINGDVDGDGEIAPSDITALLSIIFDENSGVASHETADVNGDGKIDIADITALVNIILRNASQ